MSGAHAGGLGAGLFGKESQANYDVYLNLTPLMDVMSNILFFLLSAFGASAVALFSVTVPIDASDEQVASDAPPEDKTTVNLRADAQNITLSCSNPAKLPADLTACAHVLPKREGRYDVPALSQALVGIKQAFAGATTIVVVPDDDVRYETLVELLDASRDVKQGDGTRLPLFVDVVLSSLVK